MRDISREEHEFLLNLFILKIRYEFYFEFIDWESSEYEELMKGTDIITLKDFIPMDEVCEQELFCKNRECYYKAINWIQEA